MQSKFEVNNLKPKLSNKFKMKDLGYVKRILGIDIFRTSNKLFVSQQLYLEKVLKRFSMFHTKIVSLPLGSRIKLSCTECPAIENEKEYMKRVLYSNGVGTTPLTT